jgi:Trk-type K+ transport system membrane component
LIYTVLCYNLACISLGTLACQACVAMSPDATRILRARDISSFFFSAFSVVSAFGNCGFILLDENLVPLRRSALPLLCLNALMLLGGTLYAPALRFLVWILHRASKGRRRRRAAYGRLLEGRHSLRFAHLFPAEHTRSLLVSAAAINGSQVLCMLGMEWKSEALRGAGGAGDKLLDALFQAIATRSSGMNVMDLALLSAPTLFLICIFM